MSFISCSTPCSARWTNYSPTQSLAIDRTVPQHGQKTDHEAFHEGFSYVLKADIASFFDQICWQNLEDKLDAVPAPCRHPDAPACGNAYEPGCRIGRHHPRDKGLLQGSPLSPLLSSTWMILMSNWLQCAIGLCAMVMIS
nr:reverse transcriptase domain-containing protein [Candidatus Electrothrix aestuarii]